MGSYSLPLLFSLLKSISEQISGTRNHPQVSQVLYPGLWILQSWVPGPTVLDLESRVLGPGSLGSRCWAPRSWPLGSRVAGPHFRLCFPEPIQTNQLRKGNIYANEDYSECTPELRKQLLSKQKKSTIGKVSKGYK